MPDTLVSLTSPPEPSIKTRCAKKAAPRPAANPSPVILQLIFGLADKAEIATHRAGVAIRVVDAILEEVSAHGVSAEEKGDDRLKGLSDQLFLMLNVIDDHVKDAHANAERIAETVAAARRVPADPIGTQNDEELITLRLQLKAAEDAVNATDNDESPLIDAYHKANDRFLDAPARTPAGMLLKLERLADLGEMENDPAVSTNRIVLNLIRDLRAALGTTGQVN